MNLDIFAPTTNLMKKRAATARTSQCRAFFVPYCQVFCQDIAVACTLEVKPYYPYLILARFAVRFVVNGKVATVFLVCLINNYKSTMQSKSTQQAGYTPEQQNFIDIYTDREAAATAAKALRMLCISILESGTEHNPKHLAQALFLAEMLNDVSLTA